MSFYQEPLRYQYNFMYINCMKNYLINCVDNLLQNKNTTMYYNKTKFIIHPVNKPCNLSSLPTSNNIESQIKNFIENSYPKNKMIYLVFNVLTKNKLINDDLFFVQFPNIHVADFCSFLLNRFGKKEKTDLNLLKLCKYLKNYTFPKIALKNPVAIDYLT
jgi:hypothetical protein